MMNGLSIRKTADICGIHIGRVSTKDLHKTYDKRIESNSILCTDKMNSYKRFATANGLNLIQLKSGKSKQGIFNIQHINSYHSELKRFLYAFKGVSTKYLNNYLTWNNFVNYSKETSREKANILLKFTLTTQKTVTYRGLASRPSIPIMIKEAKKV